MTPTDSNHDIRGPAVSTPDCFWRIAAATLFCVFLIVLSWETGNAGEKRWITANGAKLRADKSATSDAIGMLPGGAEVTILSSEKRWYQVSSDSGKTGWVYRGKLSADPPDDSDSDMELMGELADTISLDAADTSRSIRGKPKSPKFAVKTETDAVYSEALETVLSFYAGKRQVDDFLKAGKIGEYAD